MRIFGFYMSTSACTYLTGALGRVVASVCQVGLLCIKSRLPCGLLQHLQCLVCLGMVYLDWRSMIHQWLVVLLSTSSCSLCVSLVAIAVVMAWCSDAGRCSLLHCCPHECMADNFKASGSERLTCAEPSPLAAMAYADDSLAAASQAHALYASALQLSQHKETRQIPIWCGAVAAGVCAVTYAITRSTLLAAWVLYSFCLLRQETVGLEANDQSSSFPAVISVLMWVQESEGNILDDEVLINTLNNSKLTAGKNTSVLGPAQCLAHHVFHAVTFFSHVTVACANSAFVISCSTQELAWATSMLCCMTSCAAWTAAWLK